MGFLHILLFISDFSLSASKTNPLFIRKYGSSRKVMDFSQTSLISYKSRWSLAESFGSDQYK